MKTLNLLLTTLMLFVLVACDQRGKTIVEKHYVTNPNTGTGLPGAPDLEGAGYSNPNGSDNMGGVDGVGGGNGFAKKSLESWKVDLTKLPAFERLHEKVISKLKVRFPNLAADLLHIAEERSWYVIPVELRTLPTAKIGVSFRTEQIALQKLKEIWISDLIFGAMDPVDQEMLILHELLMGVRLLEFTNVLDQCVASISILRINTENLEPYKEARKVCYAKNRRAAELGDNLGFGKNINLDTTDYEETIRPMTSLLMEKAENFDVQELEDWMVIRKFRIYPKTDPAP